MGRHSAPDDPVAEAPESPDSPVAPQGAASAVAVRAGRHVRADEPDETTETAEMTEVAAAADAAPADADAAPDADVAPTPGPGPEATATPRRESATRADLRLLREHPALRARCAAGAVVPFVLYVVVLIVIGAMSSFLLWVWIPTVTAGAVVGGLLDVAHRHEQRVSE